MGRQFWFPKLASPLQECPFGVTEEAGFIWNLKKEYLLNQNPPCDPRRAAKDPNLETPAPAILYPTKEM